MLIPQRRSFGACSGFLMDTCPLGTRRNQVTYYMALIGVLQWEAAWLRRDAIAPPKFALLACYRYKKGEWAVRVVSLVQPILLLL